MEEIKVSMKCVQLILQRGLAYDGGAPAFVSCDIPNGLPHIFRAAGVEVPLQSLLMSHLISPGL